MTTIAMTVDKGCLRPANATAQRQLRGRNYQLGDTVFAEIRQPRNPKYHRLAHALGQLASDNLGDFEGVPAHDVLKRLQLECGIECDEVGYRIGGEWVVQRIPRSLSFESMDQERFEALYRAMCRHLGMAYFGGLSPEQVAEMVELMPDD